MSTHCTNFSPKAGDRVWITRRGRPDPPGRRANPCSLLGSGVVCGGMAEGRAGNCLSTRPSALVFGLAVALVGLVGFVFWPSLSTPFFFDDLGDIVGNPDIRGLWPPAWLFAGFPSSNALAGRPVSALTFALNYAWGGLQVEGYHLVNIALHAGAALLLFGLVRRTLALPRAGALGGPQRTCLAGLIAAVWAVHPLQTEPVAYTIQRTELLAGFFFLAALYAAQRTEEQRVLWGGLAVLASALAMGSKEIAVAVPIAVVLHDRVFREPAAVRTRRWLHLAVASTWLVLLALLAGGQRASVPLHAEGVSPLDYLFTQGRVLARYLRLVVWPHPLVIAYDWPARTPVAVGLLPFLLVASLLLLSAWAAWRRHALGFLGLAAFAILAPSSSLVPLTSEVVAERRMYLPLAACVTVLVLGVRAVLRRLSGRTAVVAAVASACVVIALLSAASRQRLRDYRSSFAIWADAAAKSPQHSTIRGNLGRELVLQKRFREAIPHLEAAIALRPELAAPHYLLGFARLAHADSSGAVVALREAARLDPKLKNVHYLLGNALRRLGHYREAAGAYAEAVRLAPGDVPAQVELSDALAHDGDITGAIAALGQAIQRAPGDAKLRTRLASLLVRAGRPELGRQALEAAVRIDPGYGLGHLNLGNALAAGGDLAGAVREYLEAVRSQPDDERVRGLALARLRAIPPRARDLVQRAAQTDPSPAVRRLAGQALSTHP